MKSATNLINVQASFYTMEGRFSKKDVDLVLFSTIIAVMATAAYEMIKNVYATFVPSGFENYTIFGSMSAVVLFIVIMRWLILKRAQESKANQK